MIIVLSFAAMLIIGIIITIVTTKKRSYLHSDWDMFGEGLIIFSTISLVICVIIISGVHIHANIDIITAETKYESLCKEYELIQSDYEDISKVTVITDITEWNMQVQETKYWSESPFYNWFYDKEYVNSLQYIDISEIN